MFYSVCTNTLFPAHSIPEAIAAIREAGASAYEFWGWWGQDIDAIAAAQARHELSLTAMCTRMVPLNDTAQREEYLDGLRESIGVAKKLNCTMLISQVGRAIEGISRARQHDSIVEGLRACAPVLEEAGVTLVFEPLNPLNHPGYYLPYSAEAFEIVREVDSPRVKALYDVYHQQISEGNLIANITANIDLIGHIHVAGVPGRHEILGDNEIHYPAVFAALKNAGYDGAIGLEYLPTKEPIESLRELFAALPLNER